MELPPNNNPRRDEELKRGAASDLVSQDNAKARKIMSLLHSTELLPSVRLTSEEIIARTTPNQMHSRRAHSPEPAFKHFAHSKRLERTPDDALFRAYRGGDMRRSSSNRVSTSKLSFAGKDFWLGPGPYW